MKNQQAYRQGDVIIVPIKAIPKGAKKQKNLVLAEGEVTGHMHRVTTGPAELFKEKELSYLRVGPSGAIVTHEEHGPVALPEGVYEIKIQREYEPEGWRNVAD